MSLTAAEITWRLARERYRASFVVPNYTPHSWFECDLFQLMPSGRWREYEVKLTRSDFKADARKALEPTWKSRYDPATGRYVQEVIHPGGMKHDLLAAKDERGPNQFFFVVPDGLVKLEELPPWAGLIEVGRHYWGKVIVPAPSLNKSPMTKQRLAHARGICYYRMHDLICTNRRLLENARNKP